VDDHAEFLRKGYEEAKVALTIAQENMVKYYDRRHCTAPKFSPGDKAWLDAQNIQTDGPSRKLSHKCLGPYEVVEQIGKASYHLKLSTVACKRHVTYDDFDFKPPQLAEGWEFQFSVLR
jgi:hypothetical protein